MDKIFSASTRSTNVIRNKRTISSECKICEAPAFYSYYGAIVCISCKIFFKRYAETKWEQRNCRFNRHCQVNIRNRNMCFSCRLAKCFARGMQISMLRASKSDRNRTDRNNKMAIDSVKTTMTVVARKNKKCQAIQLPTLNLLQSMLNMNQWNLLLNLTHCFDEYSGLLLAQQFMRDQDALPLKMRFKLGSVVELLTSFAIECDSLFEKNRDFVSLCSHDRSVLLNNTIENVRVLGMCFLLRHAQMYDSPGFYKCLEGIYGPSASMAAKRASDQIDSDITFFKLILATLSFSTFHYTSYSNVAPINLTNIKTVLRIQNMYVELAWQYLLSKYGYLDAVRCFSNLIRCLFSVNNAVIAASETKHHRDRIYSFATKTYID